MARKNSGDDFSPKNLGKFELTTKEMFNGIKTRKKPDSSDIPLKSLEVSDVSAPPLKPDLPDIPLESLEVSNVAEPPLKPDLPNEHDNTSTNEEK
ncbi:hypothetical protein CAL7716_101530 (plasmid) [Calothrix sp. PCC 7716]|nr:hypothetical protein CAL7716_101530 [Calothrix sp. PCC 7716]